MVQRTRGGAAAIRTADLYVGILNYELRDVLLVQVVMRLEDPRNGVFLGRTRAYRHPWAGTTAKAVFADDGKRFKSVFETAAKETVEDCLRDLGLAARK